MTLCQAVRSSNLFGDLNSCKLVMHSLLKPFTCCQCKILSQVIPSLLFKAIKNATVVQPIRTFGQLNKAQAVRHCSAQVTQSVARILWVILLTGGYLACGLKGLSPVFLLQHESSVSLDSGTLPFCILQATKKEGEGHKNKALKDRNGQKPPSRTVPPA